MKINVLFYLAYSKIILISLFLNIFSSLYDSRNFSFQLSEINLIIKGPGNHSILSQDFYIDPSEVIVNEVKKPYCKKICDFDKDLNNVILKFDTQITSCSKMFYELDDIIEIDLSNLNTSKVINMESMFCRCINLNKINFGKIDTSSSKYEWIIL